MKITIDSKSMMIRQILNKLTEQRDRIIRVDDGKEKTRELLADYEKMIRHYRSMDPALFQACQYTAILTGLSEIDSVITDRERLLSARGIMIEVAQ